MSKNILIVEDNQDMQKMYENYFSDKKGAYDVEIVGDGFIAFEKSRAKKYDLIILDMVMEPMSGETLFAISRDVLANAKTPVMVASILGSEAAEVEAVLEREDTYHMTKPVFQEELLQNVEKILAS